jgi:hypothetical protein
LAPKTPKHDWLPEIGAILEGRYRLDVMLGDGPVGAVYSGVDLETDQAVVLKVVSPALFEGPLRRTNLFRVTRTLGLDHPHVAQIHDLRIGSQAAVIVAEPTSGVPLAHYVRSRPPLLNGEILELFEGLTAGLLEVHRSGAVHGNLKPSNVLVDYGRVTLLDPVALIGAWPDSDTDAIFLAPEQRGALDAEESPLSDVWALGLLLGFVMARAPVLPGVALSAQGPGIPNALDPLFLEATESDPRLRTQSIDAFLAAVREALPDDDVLMESVDGPELDVDSDPKLALVIEVDDDVDVVEAEIEVVEFEVVELIEDSVVTEDGSAETAHLAILVDSPPDFDVVELDSVDLVSMDLVSMDLVSKDAVSGADETEVAGDDLVVELATDEFVDVSQAALPEDEEIGWDEVLDSDRPAVATPVLAEPVVFEPVSTEQSIASPVVVPEASSPPDKPTPAPLATKPAASPKPSKEVATPSSSSEEKRGTWIPWVAFALLLGAIAAYIVWGRTDSPLPPPQAKVTRTQAAPPVAISGLDKPVSADADVGSTAPTGKDTSTTANTSSLVDAGGDSSATLAAIATAATAGATAVAAEDGGPSQASFTDAVDAADSKLAEDTDSSDSERADDADAADSNLAGADSSGAGIAAMDVPDTTDASDVFTTDASDVADGGSLSPIRIDAGALPDAGPAPKDSGASASDAAAAGPDVSEVPPAQQTCPGGMVKIARKKKVKGTDIIHYTVYCVDRREYPGAGKPRTNIGLWGAKAACDRKGKRLCSGQEWRSACGSVYPYGRTFDPDKCNTMSLAGELRPTVATGKFKGCRSGWGVYDMVGNVAEWTADGRVRGGDSYKTAERAKCSYAPRRAPSSTSGYVGFRCCADPTIADPTIADPTIADPAP